MRSDGLQIKTTRHATYQSGHHFVWIPHYRRNVLRSEVEVRTKALVLEAGERHGIEILDQETDQDHVHVFASIPPRMSASQAVGLLKGYSSKVLREEFPWLKKVCGKDKLWAASYYWGTCGNVSAQTVRRYITECQGH